MKNWWLWVGSCLFLVAVPCFGADIGIVTVVDGKPKVLRGTTWYKLIEGGAVRDGDVVDAPENSQFELEMVDGGAVSIVGPGALYAVSMSPRVAKTPALGEFFVTRGWLKFTTKPTTTRLRIRATAGTIATSNATAVANVTPETMEVFVESGLAKVSEPGKLLPEGPAGDVKDGGFASRAPGKPFVVTGRASTQFVAALPRDFMDPLPMRASKYKAGALELSPDREATYADAQPWLSGPYRAAFVKRFEPKLADPAFRAAAAANSKATPEWAVVQPTAVPMPAPTTTTKAAEAPKEKPAEERTWRWPWESNKK
jgi:hypothetical protein